MNYEKVYSKCVENLISGRYINLSMIKPLLQGWSKNFNVEIVGQSVQHRPIYECQIGHGKSKILIWSQMHGNESTTTKGLIDFMNLLNGDTEIASAILRRYSFYIIPMLNPDGAEVYTRANANDVDLNRDFQNLTQPESSALMRRFKEIEPDFCFNLHDQRTIFGVGTTGKPATLSFLAPAFNAEKEYDTARLRSVEMIMKMVGVLQDFIPGQIGRFDDSFNNNCVGDAFQSFKIPTILIEAGHYQGDYEREITRKYVFIALLSVFNLEHENVIVSNPLSDYLRFPQNMPNFFDFVYKNVKINYEKSDLITNFAVQFREELLGNKIIFNGFIAKIQNIDGFFGHVEHDADNAVYSDEFENIPKLDTKASFYLNNKVMFVNGLVKI